MDADNYFGVSLRHCGQTIATALIVSAQNGQFFVSPAKEKPNMHSIAFIASTKVQTITPMTIRAIISPMLSPPSASPSFYTMEKSLEQTR
ncbi:MAG: hypothetical protein WCF85_21975, partial [Rhodospirillaceae bacterium]